MFRNTQRQSLKTPTKKSKKSKKTTDYSSDSSYAGVDLISDSEDNDSDDEPDVFGGAGGSRIEKYEEAAMFESAEEDDDLETIEDDTDAHDNPQATKYSEEWEGFSDVSEDTIHGADLDPNNNGILKKRVTFVDDDTDSSISDDEAIMWHPDLFETETSIQGPFLSADALPPNFASQLDDDTWLDDDHGHGPEEWENDDSGSGESDSDDSDASGYQCKWG